MLLRQVARCHQSPPTVDLRKSAGCSDEREPCEPDSASFEAAPLRKMEGVSDQVPDGGQRAGSTPLLGIVNRHTDVESGWIDGEFL
jgi:hypothetical protein